MQSTSVRFVFSFFLFFFLILFNSHACFYVRPTRLCVNDWYMHARRCWKGGLGRALVLCTGANAGLREEPHCDCAVNSEPTLECVQAHTQWYGIAFKSCIIDEGL